MTELITAVASYRHHREGRVQILREALDKQAAVTE